MIESQISDKNRFRSILDEVRILTHRYQNDFPWSMDDNSSSSINQQWIRCLKSILNSFTISFLLHVVEILLVVYQLVEMICSSDRIQRKNFQFVLEILSIVLFIYDIIQLVHWLTRRRKHRIFIVSCIIYAISIHIRLLGSVFNLINITRCSWVVIWKSVTFFFQAIVLILYLFVPFRWIIDYLLNRYISVSYDIGLTYLSSEEQVLQTVHRLTDNGT